MRGGSILIVATWGYPPTWRRAKYTVKINHPAFRNTKPVECTSCSTTVALASYFAGGWDVNVLIFGVDTASAPRQEEDGTEFRERIRRQYEEWRETLVKKSEGCPAETLGKVKWAVEVLPGLGTYYRRQFLGSPLLLFNAAVASIVKKIEEVNPSFLVVDLSHGINFQLISVLYAAVAAAIIKQREDRFLLFNSDPYPPDHQSETCIRPESTARVQEEPSLNLNEVTELQRVVGRIRQITALRRLQMPELEKGDQDETLRQLLTYICALANGAATPCFKGARYDDGTKPVSLPQLPELSPPDTTPKVGEKTVEYPTPDRNYAVKIAIREVVRELEELQADNLVDFLNKVADRYEKFNMLQNTYVLRRTAEELGRVIQHYRHERRVEVPADDVVRIILRSKETRGGQAPLDEECRKPDLKREKEDIKAADNPEWAVRNLLAHGGFSYAALKHIVIENGKITEVVYDKDVLSRLLSAFWKKCKIGTAG